MLFRNLFQPGVIRRLTLCALVALVGAGTVAAQFRARVVPGRGQKVEQVGDDFEAEDWEYYPNAPKSSTNLDKQDRLPSGISKNQRIYESTYRGQPDIVKRVETPPGGIPGSRGAMLIQSTLTGVPGYVSRKQQQDDLLVNVTTILGGPIAVSQTPSCVVRVYLPPWEQWERRTGSHFGFRAELETTKVETTKTAWRRMFRGGEPREQQSKVEAYWPGFFIQFHSKHDGQHTEDSAMLLMRAGSRGEEVPGPMITEPGWWTLGMSFTGDGLVHYYAHAGVEPLTEKDHISTQKPYGYTAQRMTTFFFNVVNVDDGRTISTPWIIDDPTLYLRTR
ncbi:MAG: hypothetical protein NT069_09490 [Planctomycetota bacterium]|nr:hypothetical protein [Planctomycetota bacterium]